MLTLSWQAFHGPLNRQDQFCMYIKKCSLFKSAAQHTVTFGKSKVSRSFNVFVCLVSLVSYEQGAWTPLGTTIKKKKTLQPEVRWTVAELVFNRKLVHTGDTLFSSICPHLQQGATTIVQWACTVILITCHKALGGLCPHDPLDSRSISGLTHVGESHTLLLPSSKSPLSFLLSSSLCFFLHPVPWILCHLHYSMLCKY